jgi:hypothetical protein
MMASQYDISERNDFRDNLLKDAVQFLMLYWMQVVDVGVDPSILAVRKRDVAGKPPEA